MRVILKFTLPSSPILISDTFLILTSQTLFCCLSMIFIAVLCTFTEVIVILSNVEAQQGTELSNEQQCKGSKKMASHFIQVFIISLELFNSRIPESLHSDQVCFTRSLCSSSIISVDLICMYEFYLNPL